VRVVHHGHVERCGDRRLFLVAADMLVVVIGAAVGGALTDSWRLARTRPPGAAFLGATRSASASIVSSNDS
jgi:hypothetical protein